MKWDLDPLYETMSGLKELSFKINPFRKLDHGKKSSSGKMPGRRSPGLISILFINNLKENFRILGATRSIIIGRDIQKLS
jgi:hypothetical protein